MNRLLEDQGRPSVAQFLDVDGGLAPIARHPDPVQPDARLRAARERMQHALDGAVAVISGRPLSEVDGDLTSLQAPGAGTHGGESGSVLQRGHRAVETLERRPR